MLLRTQRSLRAPKRAVAWGLTLSMIFPPVGGLLSAVQAQSPNRPATDPTMNGPALPPPLPYTEAAYGANSLLLFPFVNNSKDAASEAIPGQVIDALKLRISLVGSYQVTSFSKFLAPVQRALDDNVLAPSDTTGPFDNDKAGRVAAQVQTNDYLTGAVESFSADPATRQVTIEVSANLRNSRTGKSLKTLAFTGTGIPFSNVDTLDVVTQRAVNSVASKIAAAIYPGKSAPMTVESSARGHNKGGQVFLVSLLTGALLFAILHNSGGGGSSSGSTTTGGIGTGSGSGTTTTSSGPPAPPSVN